MKKILLLVLSSSFLVVSCSKVRESAGVNRKNIDEFTVIENPPLVIPPDFNLLPPDQLEEKNLEKAGGNKVRQFYKFIEGIEQTISKQITAEVKSSKIKVQVKINGNELRVDGKKKDDLQSVMQIIENSNIGIPIQFINFRD